MDIIEAENASAQVDESEEEEGVTRCVCGKSDSFGLMICCEGSISRFFSFHLLTDLPDCGVWQHTECVGLTDKRRISRKFKYYCELCRPDGHPYFKYDLSDWFHLED